MDTIAIVDEFRVPGQRVDQLVEKYVQEYAPAARERGMTLVDQWLFPGIRLEHGGVNTITFVWSVPDLPAFWQARFKALFDPRVDAFWKSVAPMIVGRTRRYHERSAADV